MNRIGIDTNVLLRLLVNDNQEQRASVLKFGEGLGTRYLGYITIISLVEIDWALRKQYGFAKKDSVTAIRKLLRIRGIEVQSPATVSVALQSVDSAGGEFADVLIAHLCMDAGCSHIVTFDRKAAGKIPVMELLA